MVTQQNKAQTLKFLRLRPTSISFIALALLSILVIVPSCSSDKVDFAVIAPADTLIYIESIDLGKALGAVTSSRDFKESVESSPDFSAVNGMRVGIMVTGMDAQDDSAPDLDGTEIRIKPRFVLVANSDSWFWDPADFLEGPIADFVAGSYGKGVKAENIDDKDGIITAWKAVDGRRVFAMAKEELVFFSNDIESLRLVLATHRGERDNLSGNSALQKIRGESIAASGYISQRGVAQLSNFVGISTALATTDDEDGKSFIARVVPDLLRANVREVLWTSTISNGGITDQYEVVLSEQVSEEMSVAMQTVTRESDELLSMIPSSAKSVTRYDLASPSIAWDTLIGNLTGSTDILNGSVLGRVADGALASYGITLANGFASAATAPVFTASLDETGEQVLAVFKVRDPEMLKSVVAIDFIKPPESVESFSLWKSDDDEFAYAEKGDLVILGEMESVMLSLSAMRSGEVLSKMSGIERFIGTKGATVTLGKDSDSIDQLAKALSLKTKGKRSGDSVYVVATEFTSRGIVRKTSSSSGLIGALISQFSGR